MAETPGADPTDLASAALDRIAWDVLSDLLRQQDGLHSLTAEGLHLPVRLYDPSVHYREDAGRPFGFGDTSEADRRATIEQNVSSKPVDFSPAPIDVNRLLRDSVAAPSSNRNSTAPKSQPK